MTTLLNRAQAAYAAWRNPTPSSAAESRAEPAFDQTPEINNATRVVRSSDPEVLELLGARSASSGVYVNAETAKCVSAVYACVTRIAGGISTIPAHIYERTWNEQRREYERRRVDNADLWWLLNEQPAAAYAASSHWNQVIDSKLLRGDGYTEIRRKRSGTISELVPFPWEAVTPAQQTLQVGSRLMYAVNDGLSTRGVEQDDMLHFPGFGFDGIRGCSVISHAARNAAGNALAMDEYAGKFFANGAHASIVLESPNKVDETLAEQLRKAYRERYSGLANAHKNPLVLSQGVKATSLNITPEDAQLIDSRRYQVIDVARAFGVPPHMIGETSASTSWGSGIEEMNIAFVMYTLQPHLVSIEQELNRKLFRTAKYFIEFDRDALLAANLQAQANLFKSALGGPGTGPGWMSKNEVRKAKNLPPVEGGDALYEPDSKAATPNTSQPNPPQDPSGKQGA
jgi:HK97 family phage portal protein